MATQSCRMDCNAWSQIWVPPELAQVPGFNAFWTQLRDMHDQGLSKGTGGGPSWYKAASDSVGLTVQAWQCTDATGAIVNKVAGLTNVTIMQNNSITPTVKAGDVMGCIYDAVARKVVATTLLSDGLSEPLWGKASAAWTRPGRC